MKQERERNISRQSIAEERVSELTEDDSSKTLSVVPATDTVSSSMLVVPATDNITLPDDVMALQTQVKKPIVMVSIGTVEVQCLLDTGAAGSLISSETARKINKPILPTSKICTAANETSMKVVGCVDVEINIGNRNRSQEFLVVEPLSHPMVLGINFLAKWGIIPLMSQGAFIYEDKPSEKFEFIQEKAKPRQKGPTLQKPAESKNPVGGPRDCQGQPQVPTPGTSSSTDTVSPTNRQINIADKAVRPLIIDGQYQDDQSYIDAQFAIHQEDFQRPIRMALHQLRAKPTNSYTDEYTCDAVHIYQGVQFEKQHIQERGGRFVVTQVKFSPPTYSPEEDKSDRLRPGSAVMLSNDNFNTILYALVRGGNIMNHSVDLDFYHGDKVSGIPMNTKEVYIMVESQAYFEGIHYNLQQLKGMNQVPFSDYVV